MASRRDVLFGTAAGATALSIWPLSPSRAQGRGRSVRQRLEILRARLAPQGWTEFIARATGGDLNFGADDLMAELSRPVRIDRSIDGLQDFSEAGTRGIEPGKPAASLLYHLMASPNVRDASLATYPTLAEIETVEDAVYAARRIRLDQIVESAGSNALCVVVMATQYRQASDTVHGRHADMVYSRTGISRMGTTDPLWNGPDRGFDPLVADDPFAFRSLPQRFAAYLAVRQMGQQGGHGPMEWFDGVPETDDVVGVPADDERGFWIPVHKLFDGDECLVGSRLGVTFGGGFINEKLARFHRHLQIQGFRTDWAGEALTQPPFVMRDDLIAAFSQVAEHGAGLVQPRSAAFVNRARFQGDWLGFTVPQGWTNEPGVLYFSSGQILNVGNDVEPTYESGGAQETDRTGPEYISLRHRLLDDGSIDNLNDRPDMWEILRAGGYRAQHYIDFSGEGWVSAQVTGLDDRGLGQSRPAVCLVSPPDFFPQVSQRDLMDWWRSDVPEAIRDALWAIPPYSLASRRFSGNINLPAGFSIRETDTTAIVGQPPLDAGGPRRDRTGPPRYSGLPDHSPGYFDPGWDASQGIFYRDESEPLQRFLQNYGLGTPFVEDVKLCAALGSYWPAIAPDSARNFTPLKAAPGFLYPWPSIVPLTDEETGIADVGGRRMPWDGVNGPHIVERPEGRRVSYADINRVDYIVLPGTMTAALLSRIDLNETRRRVMAMETAYWALGIHDPDYADAEAPVIEVLKAKAAWSAVSFRKLDDSDGARAAASAEVSLAADSAGAAAPFFEPGRHIYRFHLYRPGEELRDPGDLKRVLLTIEEEATVYVCDGVALIRRADGNWRFDDSLPTG